MRKRSQRYPIHPDDSTVENCEGGQACQSGASAGVSDAADLIAYLEKASK
jgi:hypothetical protein